MKTFILILLLCLSQTIFAQTANPGLWELQTQLIGWEPILPPKGNVATAAKAAANPNYSAARRKLLDTFDSWIRQSYVPLGGLPEPWYNVYPETANAKTYIPVTYGTSMRMWTPAYTDQTRTKLTRAQPASSRDIIISVNSIPGMFDTGWFNSPTQFYFTMDVDTNGVFVDPKIRADYATPIRDVKAAAGNHLVYVTGQYINVMLIPGDKLPVVPVSRREALDVAEAGIKKSNAEGNNPTDRMNVQLETVRRMREKYKDSLDQPARLNNFQFQMYTLDTTDDVFADGSLASDGSRILYPVYKIAPEIYAKSKTNQPLWITISFPLARNDMSDSALSIPSTKSIWKAMTENFDYQYVYDYFFNPQKVAGKSYQPLKPAR